MEIKASRLTKFLQWGERRVFIIQAVVVVPIAAAWILLKVTIRKLNRGVKIAMTKEQQKAEILKMCKDSYDQGLKDYKETVIGALEELLQTMPALSGLDFLDVLKRAKL